MKRINDISEIYCNNKLLIKDFSNMDLSFIDLSAIPIDAWYDCIFYNTNFKKTNIKFKPNKLKLNQSPLIVIDGCDFSDNDLSYLTHEDFCYEPRLMSHDYYEIFIKNCNFENTGINCIEMLYNLKLDKSYGDLDINYWKRIYSKNIILPMTYKTIINNPFLNVPSFILLKALWWFCAEETEKINKKGITKQHMLNIIQACERLLIFDKEGYAIEIYDRIAKKFSVEQKFNFFLLKLNNIEFDYIDLSGIPLEILSLYSIDDCTFKNVKINYTMKELLSIGKTGLTNVNGYNNHYIYIYNKQISYNSWLDNITAKKRVGTSEMTFYNKVYLELSRDCNARCAFCRNQSFVNYNYNLNNIILSLLSIEEYVNAVVIGGGEPTLKIQDLKFLRDSLKNALIIWHMFTNGTSKKILDDEYLIDNFRINLSRHAVSDSDNAKIFGINKNKIMSSKDIEMLNTLNHQVTLNATCIKGGLDSLDKIIDYINFAKSLGIEKVLIQDLQRSTSLGYLSIDYKNQLIDPNVFNELLKFLRLNHYREKLPIYGTGGYVTHVFTKSDFSISVQQYLNPIELEKEWLRAVKRVFDLSIDPNGNIFENWNQREKKVKKIK